MPQQPEQLQEKAGRMVPMTTRDWRGQTVRLLGVLLMGTMLAACGRCGDFWPSSQSQIGACHSDPPPRQ
jgi:hypothetical protein